MIKLGRPRVEEIRAPLKSITFKVDEETATALEALILNYELGGGRIRGRTSAVLRRLILTAFQNMVLK